MTLQLFTICLDAMPFIAYQLPIFNDLTCDWRWTVVEGAAANAGSTKWCQRQAPRYSRDGTHEYLTSLWNHPRVHVLGKQWWAGGKDEMCNAALERLTEPCVLMQIDADEIWTAKQLDRIHERFVVNPSLGSMEFFCRYFVGQNLITTTENAYGNNPGEWLRAWRCSPGDRFSSHEPPVLKQQKPGFRIRRSETKADGLMFDHYSWVLPQQVEYKERFYGYDNALEYWKVLQKHNKFPCKLKSFLGWVDDRAMVDKLWK